MDSHASVSTTGFFSADNESNPEKLFANLVSVTFSAFDPFEVLPQKEDATEGIRYTYVGLQNLDNENQSTPRSPEDLRKEFVQSLRASRTVAEGVRWIEAIRLLETDPLFLQADITALSEGNTDDEWATQAGVLFDRLSSGHKLVLLTMTKLVETVDEKTLVLLDEPEAHLHPPLLSAFVRALSRLLIQRNGVAIIATHSPVVLQEVPRTCVWKLRRTGGETRAERPEIETFGENVGVLTTDTFGLEVTHSGFHRMVEAAIEQAPDYETVLERFNGQLGAEARSIVRALIASRDSAGPGQ
jgi:hypothetical protein